jgi:hypothetical protein
MNLKIIRLGVQSIFLDTGRAVTLELLSNILSKTNPYCICNIICIIKDFLIHFRFFSLLAASKIILEVYEKDKNIVGF